MTKEQLRELAIHAVDRTAPTNFTVDNVDAAIADEFKKMTGSINEFMRNRYDIYDIIVEAAEHVVPEKTISILGTFAEVRQVPQGQKALFKVGSLGKMRAKKFITQVGLSGVYETFRLDNNTFELGARAIGGAITVDFERMLDGAESLPELMDVITEGLVDAVFIQVQKALQAAINNTSMPAANKKQGTYDAAAMQKLVNIAKAYGGGNAVIFACPDFIADMGADVVAPGVYSSTNSSLMVPGVYSPVDVEAIAATGYIKMFRGTPIVQIPQSFVDENNNTQWIDPQYAYIFPAGKEKIVKIVYEGQTQIWDAVNRDQSIEVNAYKKVGVGIVTFNNWCIYKNTNVNIGDSAIPVYNPYGV